MISALGWHLFESTILAAIAAILTRCLRNRRAAARHSLWLLAAVKFVIPAAALASLGAYFRHFFPASRVVAVALPTLASLSNLRSAPTWVAQPHNHFPIVLFSIWFAGFSVTLFHWLRKLCAAPIASTSALDIEKVALERTKQRIGLRRDVEVRSSKAVAEPVLCGLWRPAITLPEGLSAQLTRTELEAVILHELAHAKRWDNLSGAIVHVIACVFWFYPLLWWIARQLRRECELACDEMAVQSGAAAEDYVSGVLKVCRFCLGEAVAGVSGVSGSNLKKRMEAVMLSPLHKSIPYGKALLGVVIATVTIVPLAIGFVTTTSAFGQENTANPVRQLVGQTDTSEPDEVVGKVLLRKVDPVYPPLAQQARIQGTVVLRVVVNRSGDVENVQLISGHPVLAPAAIDAVKEWKYTPYLLHGRPEVENTIQLNFMLPKEHPEGEVQILFLEVRSPRNYPEADVAPGAAANPPQRLLVSPSFVANGGPAPTVIVPPAVLVSPDDTLTCTFASIKYPEGTVIQEGVGPEQMCARVMLDDGETVEEWIHTNQEVRLRGQNVVHLPVPKPFVCTPTASVSPGECSCEGGGSASQGALALLPGGDKIKCDQGKWVPATAHDLGTDKM